MRHSLPIYRFVFLGLACPWGLVLLAEPTPAQDGKAPAEDRTYELRLIRVGNTFHAIRFKVATGESWVMNGDKYDKVPETGPVPPGNYDIRLITDDKNWMAFRIDRRSGLTWQMQGDKWKKVKEPDAKTP
jgi:hypothetical protein